MKMNFFLKVNKLSKAKRCTKHKNILTRAKQISNYTKCVRMDSTMCLYFTEGSVFKFKNGGKNSLT